MAFTPVAQGQVPDGRVEVQVHTDNVHARRGPRWRWRARAARRASECSRAPRLRRGGRGHVRHASGGGHQPLPPARCCSRAMQIDAVTGRLLHAGAGAGQPAHGDPGAVRLGGRHLQPARGRTGDERGADGRDDAPGQLHRDGRSVAGRGRARSSAVPSTRWRRRCWTSAGCRWARRWRWASLRNTGTEACYLASMQLAAGSDAAFSAAPVENTVLQPGQKATLSCASSRMRRAPTAGWPRPG